MAIIMDKRERSAIFRQRLKDAMDRAGLNKSSLSAQIGVDRSTISQLLSDNHARLPNAQVIGECAHTLGVSADWLLGLSARPERANDLLDVALSMPEAARSSVDNQLFAWHQEATGYKIRHVPATLPDFLKTPEVLRWEYEQQLGKTPDQAIGAMEESLTWLRSRHTDYEIALPRHELESFAAGTGYYNGLSVRIRKEQIEGWVKNYDHLYPSLRIFQFDAHHVFSAPLTVFGPLMATIYLGRHYIVFRDSARVQTMANHFDWLIREASVDARDFITSLEKLDVR